jgi:hypothetical protein
LTSMSSIRSLSFESFSALREKWINAVLSASIVAPLVFAHLTASAIIVS